MSSLRAMNAWFEMYLRVWRQADRWRRLRPSVRRCWTRRARLIAGRARWNPFGKERAGGAKLPVVSGLTWMADTPCGLIVIPNEVNWISTRWSSLQISLFFIYFITLSHRAAWNVKLCLLTESRWLVQDQCPGYSVITYKAKNLMRLLCRVPTNKYLLSLSG